MKKFLFLLVIFQLVYPLTSYATIVDLQNITIGSVGGNPRSVTFATSTTAGSFIVVSCSTYANPISSITDTLGNTYTKDAEGDSNYDLGEPITIWSAQNPNSGSDTITCTSIGSTIHIHASEYIGIATSSPVDQSSGNYGSGTITSGGTFTPNNDNELLIGSVGGFGGGHACTANTGLTLISNTSNTPNSGLCTVNEIQTTATTRNISLTLDNSDIWSMATVLYKSAPTYGSSSPTSTPPTIPTTTETSTTTIQLLGDINFGLAIIITILSIGLSAFIYNSYNTRKKPWQK